MAAVPERQLVRARVGCALASGLGGVERPAVERWLGGCRRLDSLVLPCLVSDDEDERWFAKPWNEREGDIPPSMQRGL